MMRASAVAAENWALVFSLFLYSVKWSLFCQGVSSCLVNLLWLQNILLHFLLCLLDVSLCLQTVRYVPFLWLTLLVQRPWALLQTWINLSPTIDKQVHALSNVEWNYFPNVNGASDEVYESMDKLFLPAPFWACDKFTMLGLDLTQRVPDNPAIMRQISYYHPNHQIFSQNPICNINQMFNLECFML